MAEQIAIRHARAAERMRRSRERKRKGLRCYTLEIRDREIEALVRHGWLPAGERENASAVVQALYGFLDRSLV
jgi:hypothetical protein